MAKSDQTVTEIEGLIRQGNLREARQRLSLYRKKAIARALALPLANLARRANLPWLSLRFLNPIVRPSAKLPKVASPAEKAEYAACLSRIGAGTEAFQILGTLDPAALPEAALYQAHVLITRWDYEGSIPLLERYLRARGIEPYARTVAKVNLLAAFITERRPEAEPLLQELLEELSSPAHAFLRGLTLQLAAEAAILAGNWEDGTRRLEDAAALLKETESLEAFFVRKWRAILELLRNPGAARALALLSDVRAEGVRRKHWETVRDCDRFRALARQETGFFRHVYFGTPYPAFRQRLRQDLAARGFPPLAGPDPSYLWSPGASDPQAIALESTNEKATETIDLVSGRVSFSRERLKPGQLLHRLLLALAEDFYRPARLASVHAAIYPEEFFNPLSSPTRVHQAIKRLKQWLLRAKAKLQVHEQNGAYYLVGEAPAALIVPGEAPRGKSDRFPLEALAKAFGQGPFRAREVAEKLSLSHRSARRLLGRAVAEKRLLVSGQGSDLRYRFPPG